MKIGTRAVGLGLGTRAVKVPRHADVGRGKLQKQSGFLMIVGCCYFLSQRYSYKHSSIAGSIAGRVKD